ncbi:MAG: MBL fold metallo-hydrolase [Porticoccaceae bacterium]
MQVAAAGPAEPALALTPHALSSTVWYFEGTSGMASRDNRGFMSNAGFVVTPAGVVIFDALATPVLAEAMLNAIRKITSQPIRYVILSHYHADHFYGLQVFKAAGAAIWARSEGRQYLASDLAQERLAQRRRDLSPWVNDQTQLVPADRWLDFPTAQTIPFALGGTRFELISGGNSHAPGDLMLLIPDQGVLFAGDLFFTGRLPFVVDGNTREWLAALSRIERSAPRIVVPGHGTASMNVAQDLKVTRAYLEFLRAQLGVAVENLQSFDEAYAAIDWSAFAGLPTFDVANRRNAYSVYLEMQAEMLGGAPH